MTTKILKSDADGIKEASMLLKQGEVVAIPTETVYGLAANAFSEESVKAIFEAKNRPCDNPLIVHISSVEMVADIVSEFPELAKKCAELFWPGPLTMVMPKSKNIPLVTSGGLDTVGVRFPSHPIAQEIITACGLPLAAPSANLSGSPSPTNAKRVFEDMQGRIPAIVDGGDSDVGVESTVISFEGDSIRILRPGKISAEDLKAVTENVIVDKCVTQEPEENEAVRSPGMKYKHYAPKARVIILQGEKEAFKEYVVKNAEKGDYCLLFDESEAVLDIPFLIYGNTADDQAHYLFERLREFDELGANKVFARCPTLEGVGLAVYNRILRSAGFNIIKL